MQRGLTLVEVLVSMMLLGFLTLGSVQLLSVIFSQNKNAQSRSLATSLANERIELLTTSRFQPASAYTNYLLTGESGTAGPPQRMVAEYGSIPDYPEFRRVVTLNYEVPAPGMLQAVVAVSWRDPRRGERTHELITYVHPALEGR